MKILTVITSISFLFSVIRVTTPILYASMSYLIADFAGISNIGIEGMMLTCALIGVIVSAAFGANALAGFIVAGIVGILLGVLLCFIVMKLKTDPTITGIAFNLTAAGGTVFLLYLAVGEKGISSSLRSGVLPQINIPLIQNIPVIGQIISGHNILTYVAFIMVPILSIFLYRTALGMHIRSCGENPEALQSVGVNVPKTRYLALGLSGLFAALGGAYMSMGYVSYFVKDMTAGRGFIAIAAASLGSNRPGATLLACLLFGVADAFASNPATQNMGIPTELVSTIPYIVTIVALMIYSYKRLQEKNKKQAL